MILLCNKHQTPEKILFQVWPHKRADTSELQAHDWMRLEQ